LRYQGLFSVKSITMKRVYS